ncbi:hypothetical protein CEXT_697661 [Caerostris extrusa]|uniref:Uncharacterized protein n=1 Tax=Caerostris extrusa TaxID=172846 RepID=A0AAV4TE82_CAEEX|nr:hypothetical protein CEXT_697661 [Caerostris extrusa]
MILNIDTKKQKTWKKQKKKKQNKNQKESGKRKKKGNNNQNRNKKRKKKKIREAWLETGCGNWRQPPQRATSKEDFRILTTLRDKSYNEATPNERDNKRGAENFSHLTLFLKTRFNYSELARAVAPAAPALQAAPGPSAR